MSVKFTSSKSTSHRIPNNNEVFFRPNSLFNRSNRPTNYRFIWVKLFENECIIVCIIDIRSIWGPGGCNVIFFFQIRILKKAACLTMQRGKKNLFLLGWQNSLNKGLRPQIIIENLSGIILYITYKFIKKSVCTTNQNSNAGARISLLILINVKCI